MMHAIAGLIGGAAADAVYLTGLWFTVQRLPASAHPLPILLASSLLRLALLLGIVGWLAVQDMMALGGFLLGFLAVRSGTTWWVGSSGRSVPEVAGR